MDDNLFSIKVNDLIDTFREGLLALTPVADRALLRWHDQEAHDDWDMLEESLYKAFVSNPAESDSRARRDMHPLPRYGFRVDNYQELSRIEVVTAKAETYTFASFISRAGKFNVIYAVEVDSKSHRIGDGIEIPYGDQEFRLLRKYKNEDTEVVAEVAPIE